MGVWFFFAVHAPHPSPLRERARASPLNSCTVEVSRNEPGPRSDGPAAERPNDSDAGSGHEEAAARSAHSRPGASVPRLTRKASLGGYCSADFYTLYREMGVGGRRLSC